MASRIIVSLASTYLAACTEMSAATSPAAVLRAPDAMAASVPAKPAFEARGVGIQLVKAKDPVVGSAIPVAVFYPAVTESGSEPHEGWRVAATQGAPMAAGRFSLIVLSHGHLGDMWGHHDLAESLAQRGYVVAALEHVGDSANDGSAVGTDRMLLTRPAQASAALDAVLADPTLGPRIDASRIGALGFSLGGYTVLALAGAHPDPGRLIGYCVRHPKDPTFCNGGGPGPRELKHVLTGPVKTTEPRIRAAFVMAPTGVFFAPDALREVKVPIFLYEAEKDQVLLPSENADVVRAGLPHLDTYREVEGAGHFVFLAPCEPAFAAKLPFLCQDPSGVDRRAVHARVQRDAAAFFAKTL